MFEKCPNCLKRVVKGSNFCTYCGEKMPLVAKTKRKKINKDFIDVDFTKGKKIGNRYKKYFLERLSEPTVSMKKSMNQESFQFGLIQLILMVLINGLTVLTISRGTYSPNGTGLNLFIGTIILQAFILLSMVISLYVSTNYLKNVPTTIQTIISRIGGLATPQLILSIALYFSVLLKVSSLYYVMLSLIVVISLVTMSFYLLSIKNNSRIPVFYTAVLAIGLVLALQVMMYSLLMRFSTNPQIYPEIIRIIIS